MGLRKLWWATLCALLAGASSAAAPLGGDESTSFDCSEAPELFGHPGATVVSCGAFYGSPRLWFVWLSTPGGAVKRFALVGRGEPFIGQGLAAAGRFLEEGGLDTNRRLDEEAAMLFLHVADARPPGWTAADVIGDFPGIGRTGFRTHPFTLTLIRAIRPTRAPSRGSDPAIERGWSPPAASLYQRAVLSRSGVGGIWEWKICNWVDGGWEEASTVELR